MLIDNGANVNAKDIFGDTALHNAVESGRFLSLDILIQFHFKRFRLGHEEVVKLLLERGANIHSISRFSGTPIELAEKIGKPLQNIQKYSIFAIYFLLIQIGSTKIADILKSFSENKNQFIVKKRTS